MFSEEFFPTPPSVAFRMLGKISKDAQNFLDPSAGKGDLASILRGNDHDYHNRKVDCIESDPELAQILIGKGFEVVGFDWLSYDGVSYYDAIVMNPPFSNGDDHLLRAWDFLHSGEIVCLLNEETVKNPHTAARQRLARLIEEHGSVEYLGDCFKRAQRSTGVNVAMVYLKKVSDDDRVEVWATGTDEKTVDDSIDAAENMLAVPDQLGNMQHYYDMGNQHMLKAFQHARKAALYMEANAISSRAYSKEQDYGQILALALSNINSARAEFGRKHRRDSWYQVFNKMQFHKWLDKKQREELLRDVEKNGNIPFTADNIKGTLGNILLQRKRLFEQSVANVFDELTKYFDGNTNHTEGWKSNDNYKVNEKLVFPYGCHFDPASYSERFDMHYGYNSHVIDIYNDLDRVLCVLDGAKFEECYTIGAALKSAFERLGSHVRSPFDNKCASSYFDIKFWKKGTVHLKFRDQELWAKFNQTAAAGKLWLGANTNGKSEWPGRKPEYASTGGAL